MTAEFRYSTYIFTTPDKVFEALTTEDIQNQYLNNTGARSMWNVGDKVLWKSIPYEKISYTWHRLQDFHRNLFDSDEALKQAQQEQSKVTCLIEDASQYHMGTTLTLVQDGFDSPESEMLKGVTFGWTMIISALKTHLETGRDLRPNPTA